MKPDYITEQAISDFIKAATEEDIGEGDHSSLASIPQDCTSRAKLLIKDSGIIAGMSLAEVIFKHIDPGLGVKILIKDGEKASKGDIGLEVWGSARSILSAERLVLNCLQRMSGIATYTRQLVEMISHTDARILDTRKTTPNFRILEKWAVVIGGGTNHRFGLFDMIMLKDNHIDYAGGIAKAINATKEYLKVIGKNLKIEVETRSLEEIKEVLEVGGVDIIMLDNMTPETMRKAVQMIDKQYKTEASGGISEADIVEVAECGVDFISIGALTHSVKSLDISLKAHR